ncbi:MAG: hypothetical protein PGN11_14275 [Quadrisphaera sp.]
MPGGHDLLGRELRLLDRSALTAVVGELSAVAPGCVAVVAAGSAGQPVHERTVADAVQAALPGARISAAHDFGGHGSAAREATVVADAALGAAVDALVDRVEAVLRRRAGRRGAELRLCRGDGGSLSAERARSAPVLVLGGGLGPAVLGAAQVAGADGCRVLLPAPDGGHLVAGGAQRPRTGAPARGGRARRRAGGALRGPGPRSSRRPRRPRRPRCPPRQP